MKTYVNRDSGDYYKRVVKYFSNDLVNDKYESCDPKWLKFTKEVYDLIPTNDVYYITPADNSYLEDKSPILSLMWFSGYPTEYVKKSEKYRLNNEENYYLRQTLDYFFSGLDIDSQIVRIETDRSLGFPFGKINIPDQYTEVLKMAQIINRNLSKKNFKNSSEYFDWCYQNYKFTPVVNISYRLQTASYDKQIEVDEGIQYRHVLEPLSVRNEEYERQRAAVIKLLYEAGFDKSYPISTRRERGIFNFPFLQKRATIDTQAILNAQKKKIHPLIGIGNVKYELAGFTPYYYSFKEDSLSMGFEKSYRKWEERINTYLNDCVIITGDIKRMDHSIMDSDIYKVCKEYINKFLPECSKVSHLTKLTHYVSPDLNKSSPLPLCLSDPNDEPYDPESSDYTIQNASGDPCTTKISMYWTATLISLILQKDIRQWVEESKDPESDYCVTFYGDNLGFTFRSEKLFQKFVDRLGLKFPVKLDMKSIPNRFKPYIVLNSINEYSTSKVFLNLNIKFDQIPNKLKIAILKKKDKLFTGHFPNSYLEHVLAREGTYLKKAGVEKRYPNLAEWARRRVFSDNPDCVDLFSLFDQVSKKILGVNYLDLYDLKKEGSQDIYNEIAKAETGVMTYNLIKLLIDQGSNWYGLNDEIDPSVYGDSFLTMNSEDRYELSKQEWDFNQCFTNFKRYLEVNNDSNQNTKDKTTRKRV
jgi:hypothetical protein